MAQQTLNAPPVRSAFTTGDSSEKGDTPNDMVTKAQANFVELYGKALAAAKFTTNASAGPAAAGVGDLTGAQSVVCSYTGFGVNNLTTRTAAQMFADMNAAVGQTYEVAIMNPSGSAITLVGGTGVTINGTAAVAGTTIRWYVVTFNSATTMTFQNIGSGAV